MEIIQANPHNALIKDQKGITKMVSMQHLASYPRSKDINYEETMESENYDNMIKDASTSNPKVTLPKL